MSGSAASHQPAVRGRSPFVYGLNTSARPHRHRYGAQPPTPRFAIRDDDFCDGDARPAAMRFRGKARAECRGKTARRRPTSRSIFSGYGSVLAGMFANYRQHRRAPSAAKVSRNNSPAADRFRASGIVRAEHHPFFGVNSCCASDRRSGYRKSKHSNAEYHG